MWRVSLRSLLARKVRLALSGFAIVIGVAFVAGSFIFTDALAGAFDGIVKGTTADVEVTPRGVGDIQQVGTDARTLPASLGPRLAALPGAAHVSATVQATGVYVIGTNGKLVGGNGPPGLAFNYNDTTSITGDPILTLTQGRLPTGPHEMALDEDAVRKAGYHLGDTVTLATPADPPVMRARLTGIVRFGSSGGLLGATLTIMDRQVLQDLFFQGRDVYSGYSLTAKDGVSQTALRDQARQVVPAGVEVRAGDDVAEDTQSQIMSALGFINTFLLVFAGVAMVVGTFLIINTFTILIAQRSRELALLRAMGASQPQVRRSVLLEAFVVGLVGSTLGLAFGYLLALGLKQLFGAVGLSLGRAGMVIEPRTVVAAYAVGIVVTMLAAWLPARRASSVSPIEAMRDDAAIPESSLRHRLVGGLAMVVVGAGLMALGATDAVGHVLTLTGLGMLVVLIGVALTAPVVGRPLIHGLGVVFRRTHGAVGELATQNSLRNPRRTAATASAFMIGLALVALMSIMGQSAKVSTDRAIEQSLTAGLIISNATQQPFSSAYADKIWRLDGVKDVSSVSAGSGKIDGKRIYITAVSPTTIGGVLQLPIEAGSSAALGGRSVLINRDTADSQGLAVGSSFTVTYPGGARTYVVGAIYATNGAIRSNLVMTTTQLGAAGFTPQDVLVFVTLTPGASEEKVRHEIDAVLADNPTVTLKDQQQFADEQRGQINTLLSIVYALLGLAVVIAVLGITNTLALSVIERTHEVGLLRAIGLARRQLRTMVRLESVAISVLGAVLGMAMGIVFGVVLQRAIRDQGIEVLSVPWLQLVVFVVAAVLAGMLAAVFPARRAARLDVLEAITTE